MFDILKTKGFSVMERSIGGSKQLFIKIYLSIGLFFYFFKPYVTKHYTKFNEIHVQEETLEYSTLFLKHFFNFNHLIRFLLIEIYYFYLYLYIKFNYNHKIEIEEYFIFSFPFYNFYKSTTLFKEYLLLILFSWINTKIKFFFTKKKLIALNKVDLRFDPVYFEFVLFFVYDNYFKLIYFKKCCLDYKQKLFKVKMKIRYSNYYTDLNYFFKYTGNFFKLVFLKKVFNLIEIDYIKFLTRGQHTVKRHTILGQRVRATKFLNNYKSSSLLQHDLIQKSFSSEQMFWEYYFKSKMELNLNDNEYFYTSETLFDIT